MNVNEFDASYAGKQLYPCALECPIPRVVITPATGDREAFAFLDDTHWTMRNGVFTLGAAFSFTRRKTEPDPRSLMHRDRPIRLLALEIRTATGEVVTTSAIDMDRGLFPGDLLHVTISFNVREAQ